MQADITQKLFEADFGKYSFVTTDSIIIEQARLLVVKYGNMGLRTLDSIQFSVALSLQQQAGLFITSDMVLQSLFRIENLPVEIK